jgi:hypothetical protein
MREQEALPIESASAHAATCTQLLLQIGHDWMHVDGLCLHPFVLQPNIASTRVYATYTSFFTTCRVAADILAYFRFSNSTVLLSLLREYTTSNSITVEAVDPGALQAEVQQLFDLHNLNTYYVVMSQVDSVHAATAGQHQTTASPEESSGDVVLRGCMLQASVHKQRQRQQQQQLVEQQRRRRMLLEARVRSASDRHVDLAGLLSTWLVDIKQLQQQ